MGSTAEGEGNEPHVTAADVEDTVHWSFNKMKRFLNTELDRGPRGVGSPGVLLTGGTPLRCFSYVTGPSLSLGKRTPSLCIPRAAVILLSETGHCWC